MTSGAASVTLKAMNAKKILLPALFLFLCHSIFAVPMQSPTWGFSIDLPVCYALTGGDGRDRFSFANAEGAQIAFIVYHAEDGRAQPFASLAAIAEDMRDRLGNTGGSEPFQFRGRQALVIELAFPLADAVGRSAAMSGWAIALYLEPDDQGRIPMLLALAYGPAEREDLVAFHLSALNSIAPQAADRLAPGPITEFLYPRLTPARAAVYALGIEAQIFAEDAEAAQSLIDREAQLLVHYYAAPNWPDAWRRFYRAIYRDSFCRMSDIAFHVERRLNAAGEGDRAFAENVLRWVQTFYYERDFEGSDFVNLVSAATEGRGDCDSRAMLMAMVLGKANIPSGIMVSRHFRHAMGLADVEGEGARFEVGGRRFLVAETTVDVGIGLITQEMSAVDHWLGIIFE